MEGYYSNQRLELLNLSPEKIRRALDIGCGNGAFGAALKGHRKCEVWGIEPVQPAAQEASGILDRVLALPVESAMEQLPEGAFDCVFLNDVLEHLVDPEAALRALKSKLAPGAVLIASLPNVRYIAVIRDLLFKKDWAYGDSGVLDRTHLRFFTQKSATRMIESCGYQITLMQGLNPCPALKGLLINLLSFGAFNDSRYFQFAFKFTVK